MKVTHKITQHPVAKTSKPQTPRQSPLVVGQTVPNPMESRGKGDRDLVMVWRATGEAYPKMEAHWVYADEL